MIQEIPGGLPSKYQKAVGQRQKQVDVWQKTVKEAGMSRDQRKEFQALVESRFHVSLTISRVIHHSFIAKHYSYKCCLLKEVLG